MENNLQKSQLASDISSKIESGKVQMRPKRYFVLRAILFALITLLTGLFVLYLVSFIIFSLRASGVWFLPSFGFKYLGTFFLSLPWVLLLTAIVSIIVLEIFLKHFTFIWRRPIFYSIIGIVILTTLGSFIIMMTDFHQDFFMRSREGKSSIASGTPLDIWNRMLHIAGPFYRGFCAPELPQVHYGIVSGINDNGFLLETQKGETLTIMASSGICCLPTGGIKMGDRVIVLGGHQDEKTVQGSELRMILEPFHVFE